MPTVLFILGWRFHFYANENNEPIHIHAEKEIWNVNIGFLKRRWI
jgi:hypothetical protein